MKLLYLVLIQLVWSSCTSAQNKGEPIDVRNEGFETYYGIYFLHKPDLITEEAILRISGAVLPSFKFVDTLSGYPYSEREFSLTTFNNPQQDLAPPDLDYLAHSGKGLSQQEKEKLQTPAGAVLLSFSGPAEGVINSQISINLLIDSLIYRKSAVVTDFITFESFNYQSWRESRSMKFAATNTNLTSQITIHLYRENEYCRAVTLGMGKFCLPDISIQDISCNSQNSFGSLINLVCQTLVENPVINGNSTLELDIEKLKNDSFKTRLIADLESNAEKKGTVRLQVVEPQEGDAPNQQFQIIFTGKEFNSAQEEQQSLISKIFGSADQIEYISHNKKILEASENARKELPRLKALFNTGLEPGFSILLKAPFTTDDGGNEWMWIEVTQWGNKSIKGILQNDPFNISDLKAGSIVTAPEKEIFDYLFYKPDGSFEGNTTGELIKRGQ